MKETGLKRYRELGSRKWTIGLWLYVVVTLLISRNTLISEAIIGVEKSIIFNFILLVLAGGTFLFVNRRCWLDIFLDKRMIMLVLSTLVIIIPMVIKKDWQLMYASILMCLYIPILLSYFTSIEKIGKILVVVLSVLGLYSLVTTYVMKPFVESGAMRVPILLTEAGSEFYNFGLAFVFKINRSYYRNFSIFREPGVYQFFIIISLFLNNYYVIWDRPWKLWTLNCVLMITMLSTFATGGIVELILFVVILFIDKKLYKDHRIRTVAIIAIAVIGIVVIHSIIKQDSLFRTLRQMVMKIVDMDPFASGGSRYNAILADMRIFFHSPLVGERITHVIGATVHNTTSTLLMFAIFGVFGGAFHVLGWIALVWEKERNIWMNLGLLLIMLMSFNTQNFTADVFFWLFPMMALVERGLPLLKLKSKEM